MTRVEKYRSYRNEISNMKYEDNSEKRLTSEKIEELRKAKSSSRLGYEEILNLYNLDGSLGAKGNKKYSFKPTFNQILYLIIAIVVIFALASLVIVNAIKL